MNVFTKDPHHQRLAARVMGWYATLHKLAYLEVAPDLTIKDLSPNIQEILKGENPYTPRAHLTDVLSEFIGSEEILKAVLAGEQSEYEIEQVNRKQPDGTMHYYTFRVIPLSPDKPAEGLFIMIEDVTASSVLQQQVVQERNQLRLLQAELARTNTELANTNEALEYLNRFKSFLISMASHDLRSPLTTIGGYAELLTEEWPEISLQQHNMLSIIRSQADQLNHMLSAMLDLDQIEQGKLTIKPVECDLSMLVATQVQSQQPLLERRGQILTVQLPDTPIYIQADPNRINQIVQNLLTNAIKYTPRGKQIACSVSMEDDQASSPRVIIKIADKGRGMTEEEQTSLFEIYYRTKKARLSKVRGRGLGLFIVKTLVEAHHGQITVDSKVGVGTTFTVSLPIKQPTQE
ncbi:MAG: sensor histidine kinase [Ardenticatenaceae bacterium]